MTTYKAHIFKQRKVGEREEVKLKLFNPDGTLIDLGGGAASLDSARFVFQEVPDSGHSREMRTENDSALTVYSGEWTRVPESAGEEEGDWYIGAIRPPGPGVYLFSGAIHFFDNSFQAKPIKVTLGNEGTQVGNQTEIYNANATAFAGVDPLTYQSRFLVPIHIPTQGDSYLYAGVETSSGGDFSGSTIPQVSVTAFRMVAL